MGHYFFFAIKLVQLYGWLLAFQKMSFHGSDNKLFGPSLPWKMSKRPCNCIYAYSNWLSWLESSSSPIILYLQDLLCQVILSHFESCRVILIHLKSLYQVTLIELSWVTLSHIWSHQVTLGHIESPGNFTLCWVTSTYQTLKCT